MKCFSLIRRKAEIRRFWNTPNVETPLDNRLIFSRGKSKRIKVVSGGSSRGPSSKMSARSYSNSTIIEKLIRIRVIRIETTTFNTSYPFEESWTINLGTPSLWLSLLRETLIFPRIEFSGRSILESQKAYSIPSKYGEREMSINQNRKEEEIHERLLDL